MATRLALVLAVVLMVILRRVGVWVMRWMHLPANPVMLELA
jgi:hypothetical protein